jgi:hypothetical protein
MQNSYSFGIVKMVPKRIVAACTDTATVAVEGLRSPRKDVLEDAEARRSRS